MVLVVTCALSPVGAADSLWKRITEALGSISEIYKGLGDVRGPTSKRPLGKRLARYNLTTGTEETVWECDGCRSPALLGNGQIAVLRAPIAPTPPETAEPPTAGIWIVPPAPTKPRLALASPDLIAILGRVPGDAPRLLVLRAHVETPGSAVNGAVTQPRRNFDLMVADLASGSLLSLRDAGLGDLSLPPTDSPDDPPPSLPRIDSVRDDVHLEDTRNTPVRLTRGNLRDEFPEYSRFGPGVGADGEPIPGSVDRYDPIWFNDTQILYIAEPIITPR
jgi:hypothetical protein